MPGVAQGDQRDDFVDELAHVRCPPFLDVLSRPPTAGRPFDVTGAAAFRRRSQKEGQQSRQSVDPRRSGCRIFSTPSAVLFL
jgi:hypothetical protein